jgi:hypothetical protein
MTSDSGDGNKDAAASQAGTEKRRARRAAAKKDKPVDYTAIDDAVRDAKENTTAKEEDLFRSLFPNEVELNSRAHRGMRWAAFLSLGAITCAYLLFLLGALRQFVAGKTLAAVLGASSLPTDWHMLVLIGIVFVIFAAVPLSLAMSLVKMISEKNEDAAGFKTPTTEAGKLFLDFCKGIISK